IVVRADSHILAAKCGIGPRNDAYDVPGRSCRAREANGGQTERMTGSPGTKSKRITAKNSSSGGGRYHKIHPHRRGIGRHRDSVGTHGRWVVDAEDRSSAGVTREKLTRIP